MPFRFWASVFILLMTSENVISDDDIVLYRMVTALPDQEYQIRHLRTTEGKFTLAYIKRL